MNRWAILIGLGALLTASSAAAQAQSNYPMADKLAAKVVAKYRSSSCEQLAAERKAPVSPKKTEMAQPAAQLLRQDAQLRAHFLSRVATPVAEKMVVCGFIP